MKGSSPLATDKSPAVIVATLPKETTYKGRLYQALENHGAVDFINVITPSQGVTDFGEFMLMTLRSFSEYSPRLDGALSLTQHTLTWCFAWKLPRNVLYFIRPESSKNAANPQASFAEDYRKGDYLKIGFQIVLCTVNVTSILDFLSSAQLVNLGNFANKLGTVFNSELLVLNALNLAILTRDNNFDKKMTIRAVKSGAEVALRIYLLYFPGSSQSIYLTLGLIAKGTGFVGTCYNEIGTAKKKRFQITAKVQLTEN